LFAPRAVFVVEDSNWLVSAGRIRPAAKPTQILLHDSENLHTTSASISETARMLGVTRPAIRYALNQSEFLRLPLLPGWPLSELSPALWPSRADVFVEF
jgi:hypothetical protein